MLIKPTSLVLLNLFPLFLGCAPEVIRNPSLLAQISGEEIVQSFQLTQDVSIDLPTGYQSLLKRGSRWDCIGKIAEGYIYKSVDQVLTVEGANVHEAYIVISDGELAGFYLPVEKAFSPISSKIKIPRR